MWICRKAKFVPISSSQIELAAIVQMIKEGLFAYQVAEDICGPDVIKGPIILDSRPGDIKDMTKRN
jgi:hypothetical protein